jgi:Sputnik virophage major capsid protein 1st domain
MSADYTTRLVRDSRLNMVTSQQEVSVMQGAAQNTYQQYIATSSSTSNLSWNIQPPSESVLVDRCMMMSARVKFSLSIGPNVSAGTDVFQYGLRESFQAFPLNSLFTTAQATINNTSVSVNTQDVLPILLHMMDEEEMQKYKGLSPTMIDRYQNYSDALNSNNNPLGDYKNAGHNKHLLPRGAHPLQSVAVVHNINAGGQDASTVSTHVGDTWVITIEADFTEPLFLSPFIFHSTYNNAALLGVNAINFVMNIDSQMKRFWSSGL